MNELALFAGAGGGILGGKMAGWRTICAVEIEEYCRRVLMQRQDDGILEPFPIWDDIITFDGKPWRGFVDVVSGGFPCQDISVAGSGQGIDGERSGLWSQMARIIGEVGPEIVFVENSPALTFRGLGTVLGDLAEMGFDAGWGVLGASDAGAQHKRKRIWILAYSSERGLQGVLQKLNDESAEFALPRSWIENPFSLPETRGVGSLNGLAYGVDRLKAIGNGQVPQCVPLALKKIGYGISRNILGEAGKVE